jgi:hypothetical protein
LIPAPIAPKGNAVPLTSTGTGTGVSVPRSTVDFGDVPDGQASAPQAVTVTGATDQELALSVAANRSPTPAGISAEQRLVPLDTPGACSTTNSGGRIPGTTGSVPASSSCEVGIEGLVKRAAGELGVAEFSIPVLSDPRGTLRG